MGEREGETVMGGQEEGTSNDTIRSFCTNEMKKGERDVVICVRGSGALSGPAFCMTFRFRVRVRFVIV